MTKHEVTHEKPSYEIDADNCPRPHCVKCDREVDEISFSPSVTGHKKVLFVKCLCHSQEVEISLDIESKKLSNMGTEYVYDLLKSSEVFGTAEEKTNRLKLAISSGDDAFEGF